MPALLGAGALVITTAGVASAKQVPDATYAKQLCTRLRGVLDEVDEYTAPGTTDPAAYRQQVLAQVDRLIASLKASQTTMKKLSPADGRKKVATLFDTYLADYQAAFQKMRDTFAAADPNSPAFHAAITDFAASLDASDTAVSDPFSELPDNGGLLEAFRDEKACKGIV